MMPGVCCELRPIHRLIKKKFVDILTLDFRSIPTKPEFYYFFPSWTKESKPVSLVDERSRRILYGKIDGILVSQSSVGMLSPRFTEPTISVEQIIPTPGSILGKSTAANCLCFHRRNDIQPCVAWRQEWRGKRARSR